MKYSKKTRLKFAESVFRKKCWVWLGGQDYRGYGRFYVPELQKSVPAHRFLFEHKYGPVPDGLELHHECRRPSCVHPSHLRAVTHKENCQIAAEDGAWWGENNGRTNKKEADIVAIILIHQELKIPVKRIVEATCIPQRTVYSYIKREAWSHVMVPSSPLEWEEYLRVYISGYLPEEDSPYSPKIRTLLQDFKNKNG